MKTTIFKIKKLSKSKKFLVGIFIAVILCGYFSSSVKAMFIPPAVYSNFGTLLAGIALGDFSIGGLLTDAIYKTASTISYGIAYIGGQLIGLESKLMAWLIDMSSFTKMPMVQIGWKVSRDFANLFFIAILIYLAFSAILNLGNSSSIQKTLFKVIVIAILINFSLMICGIIIDFSQMLFKYFIFGNLPANSKDSANFTKTFADTLHIKDVWTPAMTEARQGAGSGILGVFAQLVFVVLFIFITVIVLGSLVITLLVRNFWLWTLLILAPIAWFCGIVPLPLLKKYGKEWWDHFLKWTFMAPIIAFFVFLAITTTLTMNVIKLQQANVLPSEVAQKQLGDDNGVFSYNNKTNSIFNPFNVMQLFLSLGFLMAGLFAGQSLGSKAAGAAQKLITKTGKNVQGYMSRKTTQGVGWAGGGVLSGISKGVSKIPFLSKPLGVAGRYLESKGDAVKKAEVAKAAKRITQMSPDQLYDKFPTLTKNEKTAAIESKKMSPYQLSEIFPMLTNDQKTAAIKEMPLDQLNKIFSTLTKDQKAVTIERAMKAGDKMLKIPENMRDEAMALALEHRKKGDVGFEKELLKIDPTLHSEWQASIKEIAKLVNDKKNLDPVKDAVAIKKKEDEISNAKDDFNKQVSETLKDSKPTEIAKTTAAVMNNEKISEEVKDVFISRVADPKNFDNNMVMSTVGKITEPQQKVTFASALLKARMDRVANAANLSDRQKFEAIDDNLKAKLRKNPGLREMGFMQEFEAGLAGVGAAEGVKTEMEAKIEKAKAWFMSKESDTVGESQDVSNGQLEKQKEEQATVAKEEFKKTVEKVREERKAEAEDKKAFNQDVKNKGLDADSFHQTED